MKNTWGFGFLVLGLVTGLAGGLGAFRPVVANAQNVALLGYDPVAYFMMGKPMEGSVRISHEHEGAVWFFASEEHRELFVLSPERYMPRYGGYCAVCLAANSTTGFIPDAFVVYEGGLYLFQSHEIKEAWEKEPERYLAAAEANYQEHLRAGARDSVIIALTNVDEVGGEKTGLWLSELTHPYEVLTRAGYRVLLVSPKGGKVPIDPRSVAEEDELNVAFLGNEARLFQLENSISPDLVQPEGFAGFIFAGGHGTMGDFPQGGPLADLAMRIYESGGVVGAICHGPAGLLEMRDRRGDYFVKGREVTGFTNQEERAVQLEDKMPFLLEDALLERGAQFRKTAPFTKNVVVDGRLVTGQNPASAAGVAEAMVPLMARRALRN